MESMREVLGVPELFGLICEYTMHLGPDKMVNISKTVWRDASELQEAQEEKKGPKGKKGKKGKKATAKVKVDLPRVCC